MPKPKKNESKQDYLKRCMADLIEKEGKESDQAFAVCNAYWDDAHTAKAERQPITLTGTVALELAEDTSKPEQSNAFHMTAYTGQVIDLGWWGRYIFDVSGMKAKAKIPILREHQRDRVVGWSTHARAEGKNFLVSGHFSGSTSDAREVLALSREGYPWQCSVGISPVKIKRLEEKESLDVNGITVTGPIEIWLKSNVGEVSFVSLGADDETAAIAMADQSKTITCTMVRTSKEEKEMTLAELKEKHPDLYQEVFALGAQSVDLTAAREEGIALERERVKNLMSIEGADLEAKERAITDGLTLDAAYKLFFEAERGKKVQMLKEMREEAPLSLGHQDPVEPDRVDDKNLDAAISQKAIDLAKREGLDLGLATRRILSDNKDLAERYRRRFDA